MTTASTLSQLKLGDSAVIAKVQGPTHVRHRLMELGLIPGAEIKALRRAPLGDPLEIQVMHYHLTLRNEQAAYVELGGQALEASDADVTSVTSAEHAQEIKRIALLGNPNCGKTSLFNCLTGLHQKVGNYPGVTVEKRSGHFNHNDKRIEVIDLPGTYSLHPSSPDERIAVNVLTAQQTGIARPDAVILVLDASNLMRNLYLYTQAIELGLPMVVALSMSDIAEKSGCRADIEKLSKLLSLPVIPINAQSGAGVDQLKSALAQARTPQQRAWQYNESINEACQALAQVAEETQADNPFVSSSVFAERLLSGTESILGYAKEGNRQLVDAFEQISKQLQDAEIDVAEHMVQARYQWIQAVCEQALPEQALAQSKQNLDSISLKLDSFLVHRVFGLAAFLAIMASVFVAVFYIAAPIMDAFEGGLVALGEWLFSGLEDGPLKDLMYDGVIAGAGGVFIFVPQIAILSLFLALLEDSGYLARASFMLDRLLAACGLHGKSFIPMLTAHACAIPGIMAARNIEDKRDRLATIFVAPFMACGARLPVYALIILVFFGHYSAFGQAMILLGLYVFGIVAAAFTALIMKKTALKGPSPAFIIEFPAYRVPQFQQVARIVLRNSWLFCKKAGTIILAFSIVLWALLYYPRLDQSELDQISIQNGYTTAVVDDRLAIAEEISGIEEDESLDENVKGTAILAVLDKHDVKMEDVEAAVAISGQWSGAQSRQSYAGSFGHLIEPVIAPMGYDWKIGVGLMGAFAAREVFVATMGTIYSVGDEVGEDDEGLHAAMRNEQRADGSILWTTPTALSLLVFFAIAMQCISTVAVVKQETGTWTWPVFQLVYMNVLAYILAVLVYQIGTHLL